MGLGNDAAVVLGGSFNPPTIAHLMAMEHAMACTGAGHGIFVPSSHAYVARKARKQSSPFLFTEQERLDMLLAMVDGKGNLSVDACEYGDDGRGHTYRTLYAVRDRNPGRAVCFLTGADKLGIIPRWRDAARLLDEFHLVLFSRDGADAEAMIRADPLLRAHADTLHVVPELPGIGGISSSRVQSMLARRDPRAARLVCPGVMETIRKHMENPRR